jgi:putative addiction module component (TIGR02574 family)
MESNDAPAGSPAHSDAQVESAWATEAHRRWEAYQRGEEEMLPLENVMAEIRDGFHRNCCTIQR